VRAHQARRCASIHGLQCQLQAVVRRAGSASRPSEGCPLCVFATEDRLAGCPAWSLGAVLCSQVLRARQHLPFSVADVELLFDDELINAWRDPAMAQVLDAATDTAGVPSIFAACDVAARAATAAVVARWQEGYELALARAWCWLGAPREGASDAETAHLVQQELANGVQEVRGWGRRLVTSLRPAACTSFGAVPASLTVLCSPLPDTRLHGGTGSKGMRCSL
jgi:hypothetical protein